MIRDMELIEGYRAAFPYCEACARLDKSYPVEGFETHHIFGGSDRNDVIQNVINLCRHHHRRCTYNDVEYGGQTAREWNVRMLAIKAIKGEVDAEWLGSLGGDWKDAAYLEAAEIMESPNYLHGLRMDWYEY